ncbi:MAG: glutamate 5-kinase [Clostridia bacterium]|nr:glutamate 5-kinase [Clostridia bacterium]
MYLTENSKKIVVKVGTSTITHPTGALNLRRIEALARVLSDIKNGGRQVVLVSSGAVAAGISRLSLDHRPRTPEEKQALAAVGQSELMNIYSRFFSAFGHCVGQVLMTRDVVDYTIRRAATENTFSQLLSLGCIPIVNENDSVSSEEIKEEDNYGANDTLSAYVAILAGADLLINLSDINGLYDSDPHTNKNAHLISRVDSIDDRIMELAGGAGTERGTGGMLTKLRAARLATAAGIPMCIVNGKDPEILYEIMDGGEPGTFFAAKTN